MKSRSLLTHEKYLTIVMMQWWRHLLLENELEPSNSSVNVHIIYKNPKITFSVNLANFSTSSHKAGFLFLDTQITVKATASVSTS